MDEKQKNCFVIMGYGVKTDYASARILDLDKTYENIIRPVCESLNLNCFRSKDVAINGIIDETMYNWIYQAEIVVADISTLNANALYELGIRHALRPYSTIVIAEKELKYPFDINHIVINPYEHLGPDIGVSEATRFKKELKYKIEKILEHPDTDSPIYKYLHKLIPPRLKTEKNIAILKGYPSVSDLIKDAEKAKNENNFTLAMSILSAALKYDENNQFILQRLALATYKSEKPNKMASYKKALGIIKKLNPEKTTDPETLGLCGAIYKRMFTATENKNYLKQSLYYYERGFYVSQDYYNGINVAFLHNKMASITDNKNDAIYHSIHANKIREKVIDLCKELIKSKSFSSREDTIWVFQTIYQALMGNGIKNEAEKYKKLTEEYSKGSFDKTTFNQHFESLLKFKQEVSKKFRIKI